MDITIRENIISFLITIIISINCLCIIYFACYIEEDPISVRDALIQFIVDADHSVRLHLARNITVLFPETNTPSEHMNNFNDLKDMLRKSTLVKVHYTVHIFVFLLSFLFLCYFFL